MVKNKIGQYRDALKDCTDAVVYNKEGADEDSILFREIGYSNEKLSVLGKDSANKGGKGTVKGGKENSKSTLKGSQLR